MAPPTERSHPFRVARLVSKRDTILLSERETAREEAARLQPQQSVTGGDLGQSGKPCPSTFLATRRICSPFLALACLLVSLKESFALARYISPPTARATPLCSRSFLVSSAVYSLPGVE